MDFSQSLAMQERAKKRIPGMTQLLSKRPDLYSLGVWPTYYSRAAGARLWDLDGNEFIDMSIAGIGANVLGYADPDVDAAVCDAIAKGSSSSLNCAEEVDLADMLCELHPWAEMARFARTGGEAMAMAVRIARAHTGRDVVAFCGYHGWHDWYLAANVGTENALGEHLIPGLSPAGVPKGLAGTTLPFRYNQLNELQSIVAEQGDRLAAVVMEPLRNMEPAPGFLEGVRQLADQTGAVLVLDEISAGLRLCTGGAHRVITTVEPDIAVFSKALGNGYPIAAVIGRADIMQAAQSTFISSTNWTERIGPVAALATLRKHGELNVAGRLCDLGKTVQAMWVEQAERAGLEVEVGGMLPMSHFSFVGKAEDQARALEALYVQLMLDQGILASTSYYAMNAHSDEDVAAYAEATARVFTQIAEVLDSGTVVESLRGQPAAVGFGRLT